MGYGNGKRIYRYHNRSFCSEKVAVRAESKDDAEYIVEKQYYNQEHILNESDLTVQSFKAKAA